MANTDKHHCREIITKAVCGKGSKFSVVTHTISPPHRPTGILGAWPINHQHEAVFVGDGIKVTGYYEINVWYSHTNNSQTDVVKERITYMDLVPLSYIDPRHRASTVEVSAEAVQEPNCVEASVSSRGNGIEVRVERELAVEMVAETKMSVLICPYGCQQHLKDKDFDFAVQDDSFNDYVPGLVDMEL